MPKPVDWTPLVPAALTALRQMTAPVIDRTTLETLLKIQRRTAIRLLHQLGGQQLGKTLLIPRQQLIRELEAYLPRDAAAMPAYTASQIRRLHREAESFRFPDVRASERRTVERLPAAVQIELGRLTIEVADLRDLCAQLWVLLETCKDDWEGVERKLEGSA
jgi:flagellar motor switch/type III secretory pathway protein FliN